MVRDETLDTASWFFGVCAIGFVFNLLGLTGTRPTLPYGPGMPGEIWLLGNACASLGAVWSGAIGGCLTLMRRDAERARLARSFLFMHLLLFLLFALGVSLSFAAATGPRYYVSPYATPLIADTVDFLMTASVSLSLLAFWTAGRVMWQFKS